MPLRVTGEKYYFTYFTDCVWKNSLSVLKQACQKWDEKIIYTLTHGKY